MIASKVIIIVDTSTLKFLESCSESNNPIQKSNFGKINEINESYVTLSEPLSTATTVEPNDAIVMANFSRGERIPRGVDHLYYIQGSKVLCCVVKGTHLTIQ